MRRIPAEPQRRATLNMQRHARSQMNWPVAPPHPRRQHHPPAARPERRHRRQNRRACIAINARTRAEIGYSLVVGGNLRAMDAARNRIRALPRITGHGGLGNCGKSRCANACTQHCTAINHRLPFFA